MPEGVGYGPQNTASTGKDLNVIGNHAYGASGSITNAGTDDAGTTLLSFTTGSYYFVGKLDFTNNVSSGHNIYFEVTFNGIIVNETKESSTALIPMRFYYVIPPFTEVIVKWGAGTSSNGSVFLSGRIYK